MAQIILTRTHDDLLTQRLIGYANLLAEAIGGMKDLVATSVHAEGFVWHSIDERGPDTIERLQNSWRDLASLVDIARRNPASPSQASATETPATGVA